MERTEVKKRIVEHLLNFLTKKPLLECDEEIADAYDEGILDNLSEIMNEVEQEIRTMYKLK